MIRSPAFRALTAIDVRGASRDSLLRWMVIVPIVLALVVRCALPAISDQLATRLDFDLLPYYPLIMGFLLLMTPQFVGLVLGFLLLDERDDGTALALRVTPRGPARLLVYRMLVPTAVSFVVTIAVFGVVGTLPFSLPAVLAGGFAASVFAPVYALLIATLAQNKVQGFAVAKVCGLLVVPPILAWFVDEPAQFLIGIVPTYWPVKAWWTLQAGDPAGFLYAAIGILALGLTLRWLAGRLERQAL